MLGMTQESSEWQIDTAHASQGKFKKFASKYRRGIRVVVRESREILALLRGGQKLGAFQVGFFRSEGQGVYRIGQTGVPSAKESRLYVFPEEEQRVMYVLTIGTKEGQSDDN